MVSLVRQNDSNRYASFEQDRDTHYLGSGQASAGVLGAAVWELWDSTYGWKRVQRRLSGEMSIRIRKRNDKSILEVPRIGRASRD
jgi:hypothetical protein